MENKKINIENNKDFIKKVKKIINMYKSKNIELIKEKFKLNYGLEIDKEQLIKAKKIIQKINTDNENKDSLITKLKNDLQREKEKNEKKNTEMCKNNNFLTEIYKNFSYTLTEEEKESLKKEYLENCTQYF